jgi:SAM-dependent methyltransferase
MAGACAICGSDRVELLISSRQAPVFQNAVYPDVVSARAAQRGDLDFRRCTACGFVWNAEFSGAPYGPGYENRQSLSPAFRTHLDARAAAALELIDDHAVVVEVGCGQGDFLERLAEVGTPDRVSGLYGFDPAWRGENGCGPAGAQVFRRFFDEGERLQGRRADLIVSRHVIEHIPGPIAFLETLRRCSGARTRLAIETPDVDWILRTGAYHDFFYEHCSLFSLAALDRALARAGFVATRLERVFDEQYLWAEACVAPDARASSPDAYHRRWDTTLARAAEQGVVVVWGAGAKGANFVQLFDPGADRIAAVVDVNPAKQNQFLGGAGHAVVSPEAAAEMSPATVLVMNPAYEIEIADYLRAHDWQAEIIVVR